jgi:hypothetical protein
MEPESKMMLRRIVRWLLPRLRGWRGIRHWGGEGAVLFWLGWSGVTSGALGPPPLNEYGSRPLETPPLETVAPGVFRMGKVVLDNREKTVTFAGAVNMTHGLIEYAIVAAGGKLHESLLRTDAEPYHIHLAALFLMKNPPVPQTNAEPNKIVIAGPPVTFWLKWKERDQEQQTRLEDWIHNDLTHTNMSRGSWTYNGSRFIGPRFLAHSDRSIVSVIEDPDALVNNPREHRTNDNIWRPLEPRVPPVGTPVQIILRLEQDPAGSSR